VIEARRERKRRDLNPRSFSGRSLSRDGSYGTAAATQVST
jgi:hypothetical protein